MVDQSKNAKKRFELENNVKDEKIFEHDQASIAKLIFNGMPAKEKPWKKNPVHFQKVKISAVALIKMAMHARSGGDIEIMGNLQGYPIGDTMWVMDVYGLPVTASETRVNANQEAAPFMIKHQEHCEKIERPENVCGWYHSHPGYGCWLSGIDVTTQSTMQMMQDPAIAIVVDPKRTIAAGKVEIGCFRCYPADYDASKQGKMKGSGLEMIDQEKLADFGVHAHKYYKIPHEVFKSNVDDLVLERLWNEYWIQNLATSPLLNNAEQINLSVINVVNKLNKLSTAHGGFKQGQKRGDSNKIIDGEEWGPIEKEASKLGVDSCHGLMFEQMKALMFAAISQCDHSDPNHKH